jgi:Ni,Fe-hydrogenase III large subunit
MTASRQYAIARNADAIDRATIPALAFDDFRHVVVDGVAAGMRVASFFGHKPTSENALELVAVLADDAQGRLHVTSTRLAPAAYEFPSLTPQCPQVHLFEREIAEQFDAKPAGHPWLKPVRFQKGLSTEDGGLSQSSHSSPLSTQSSALNPQSSIGVMDYYKVEGNEIHEVAVGPVHAGVIEPGHFRFQCHGEHVFHLEISLGYQHRGVERALLGGPDKRAIHYIETAAGDTTIGHATAYGHAIEALTRTHAPPKAHALRAIVLELERLANHVGDLGAISGDVGYLPTASYCGRLRGDYLNMTALICGSRFGRGIVRPGGVGFDVDRDRAAELITRLDAAEKDTVNAVNLLWDTYSVMARLEDVGRVTRDDVEGLGLVGPTARSSGLGRDVRHDHPAGHFRFSHIPVSTWNSGDVFARAYVRWLEIQRSIAFVREQLRSLPAGSHRAATKGPLAPGKCVVSLIEGWRGEICHVALTDDDGRFARYKITDPSFHNWFALAMALRDQQISDFPLCNKSFNLSYCGHDL